MATEKFSFQAEVGKLLDIVAHSLYSQKEIFLRELISNASDACDKLRYSALTNAALTEGDGNFRITITPDSKTKTLTVSDNGIGMNHDELIETLGTIASSGTEAFVQQLTQNKDKKDKDKGDSVDLIGQFGVGFYSAFMVADKVEVKTRKAGEDTAWLWTSDGRGEFTIEDTERAGRGTDITLHLNKDAKEFLEETRIRHIVKTYSDHIEIPINLIRSKPKDGESAEDTLNTASALWTRQKKDITPEQYTEFYHHVAHAFDDPWLTLHNSVEGVLSYTNLLFVPTSPPFDLFNTERKQKLKLYVKKVFITDDCQELLPSYFRFVRGIVDSEDLPLSISREMLQHNPALTKINKALVKRLIAELKKKAEKKPEEYVNFWTNFGAVLKEGIYEDQDNREKLLEIARFRSTHSEELVSLEDYLGRMKPGQDSIYYISGEDLDSISKSPHLEGFKAKGVEVLLLTDPVDEFWIPSAAMYQEKPFKSATQGATDLGNISKDEDDKETDKKDDKKETEGIDPLIAAFKLSLGDKVKDVVVSERLTDSAVCMVAGEGDMDIHMERMMKNHSQFAGQAPLARVLEINPDHSLIRKLAGIAKDMEGINPSIENAAFLLFDQARIIDGEPVPDPVAFARRMASAMESGLT